MKRTVETELGLEPGIGELNLEFLSNLTSYGMELSLPVRLTFPGVRKMHAQLRAAFVALTFREHRLARAQNLLYAHHIGGDERFNQSDDDWHDLWDEPADQ